MKSKLCSIIHTVYTTTWSEPCLSLFVASVVITIIIIIIIITKPNIRLISNTRM